MHSYDTAVGMILRHSRHIEESHSQLVSSWLPDDPPVTIVFANIGRCLIHLYSNASAATPFRDLFGVIEELMIDGDESVQSAVATGLLEALLNEAAIRGTTDLVSLFGPNTRAYCQAWDSFTGVNTSGLPSRGG